MVKRGLSEPQVKRFLDVLQRRITRVHDGNLSKMAKELGVAQPSLWQVVKGKTRPALGTAERLARLEGISVESLLTSPRDRAAEIAREAGLPAAAIARVMAEDEGEEPRPVLVWLDRMRAAATLG